MARALEAEAAGYRAELGRQAGVIRSLEAEKERCAKEAADAEAQHERAVAEVRARTRVHTWSGQQLTV